MMQSFFTGYLAGLICALLPSMIAVAILTPPAKIVGDEASNTNNLNEDANR